MDQLETLHRRKCYLEWLLMACNGSINQTEAMLKAVSLPPKSQIEKITRLKLMGLAYSQKCTQQVYMAQYMEVLRDIGTQ
ncbi:hypothetical protein [Spirosoma agri]|uniref:Uncharacterized protein n=1 Tax=Spirosoma agri TaxID=1987381 RepID=A0A6M0IEU0_9BACT|nr:hypothetical protein [Spirosoma agri]NEU66305.1 hypothetical protein [Spirosoma agri]